MHGRLSHLLHTKDILVPVQCASGKGCVQKYLPNKLTGSAFKSLKPKTACWKNFLWFSQSMWVPKSWSLAYQIVFLCSYGTDANWKQTLKLVISGALNFFPDWGTVKPGVPYRLVLGPMLFTVYVSDLSPRINVLSQPVIFSDDTGVIISSQNDDDLTTVSHMSKWFTANKLVLAVYTTCEIKFIRNNYAAVAIWKTCRICKDRSLSYADW